MTAREVNSKEPLSAFAHAGCSIRERYVPVDGQVSIRMVTFEPPRRRDALPMVLAVGLSTVMESFRGMLQAITAERTVHYVETREKPTSRVKGRVAFDMPAFARDVEAAVAAAGLQERGYLLAGYSLGATAIMHGYARIVPKPCCLLLAEPVPVFRFPWWGPSLVRLAVPLYGIVMPIVKWYLRRFRIDTSEDPEVMRIVERALDTADPRKLQRAFLSIDGYAAWEHLGHIDARTLVIGTSKDTLHTHGDIVRLPEHIASCTLMDMEDNMASHSGAMSDIIRGFLGEMEN